MTELTHKESLSDAEPVGANNDEVICPNCCTQFRAIPVNVQKLMLDAGFEPLFNKPPTAEPVAWADDAAISGRVGNVCSTAAKRYWEKSDWVDKKNAELHKHPLYAAAPQPQREPWISTAAAPPEDTPVWLFEDGRIWVGTYTYDEGWVYTNCYGSHFLNDTKWTCSDAEFDDNYCPTHWMPLPVAPNGIGVSK